MRTRCQVRSASCCFRDDSVLPLDVLITSVARVLIHKFLGKVHCIYNQRSGKMQGGHEIEQFLLRGRLRHSKSTMINKNRN
jgi:hypothetical protein